MNNNNEEIAGFGWRRAVRATGGGQWLRDIAIALAVALVTALLLMSAGVLA